MMRAMIVVATSLLLVAILTGLAVAQELIIYPKEGQSEEQMEKDKFQCYSWAKKQTGFDPMEIPKATEAPPKEEARKGGVGRGALRGAAVGAAVGSLSGDMGKGAKYGATGGAMAGGMRRRDQKRQQEQAEQQWAQEQAAEYAKRRNTYNRAFGACLEGKGYTVK